MKQRAFSRIGALGGVVLGAVLALRMARRQARRLDFRGKKVLITGGSRGLGFAAARRFLRNGAHVAICARDADQLARAEQALLAIAAHGAAPASGEDGPPRVLTLQADVADEAAAGRVVAEVLRVFGELDVLVNCAVEISVGPLDAMTTKDFEHAFQGIFFAVYQPMMAVLPHMVARGSGRIVNVTSVAGKAPIPHNSTYVAAKFATTGFSQTSASELRKHGVRVSTVLPPPLRNGAWMNAAYKGDAEEELSWFARALHSPLTSSDPELAAEAIVQAARYGDVELMVSPSSWLQSRLHAFWPELSVALLAGLERRLMPPTPPGARAQPLAWGEHILASSTNPRVRAAARKAQPDAARYLQPLAMDIDPATGLMKTDSNGGR